MTEDLTARLRRELAETRAELHAAHARISAMEESRFWKIRNAWWRLKTRLTGQPQPEPLTTLGASRSTSTTACLPRTSDERVGIAVRFAPGSPPPEQLLDALFTHTRAPYELILVDDGTGAETAARLAGLAATQGALLVRHELPRGYAACANAALAASRCGLVALLSSEARPGPLWLERLLACLENDGAVAAVVPLAVEPPGGMDAERFVALLAGDPPIHPPLSRLAPARGLLVRKGVPRFDESLTEPRGALEAFGEALPGRGLEAVLADDVSLGGKPGAAPPDRVTAALHRRAARLAAVDARRHAVRARLEGRRVLFVLPVMERGGGANVVFSEALEMVRMGVDARVLNLSQFRPSFEQHYPVNEVPVLWADPQGIPAAAAGFDAVVATANTSVEWLTPLSRGKRPPVLGYYVQDFEPYFYREGSKGERQARESYKLIPGMVLFTKTDWNRRELEKQVGVSAAVVGPSYDASIFRPTRELPPDSPVKLAAMVRPSSPRRQPGLTMDLLERLHARFGGAVSITTFGEDRAHPDWPPLERSFPHESLGVADSRRLASLYSGVHAFLDFSEYQAMGLSALEAMACGATALLPRAGGAESFAHDGEDALLVDTTDLDACIKAVETLVEDAALRRRLAGAAPLAAECFHPAFAAAAVLEALFPVA